ncbi:MAG: cytochrome P450 [Vannielia sp.]|uniref:cytochrome P450 n=1 Tax=Vannielia sp. TaxID=2813045 RepID=UPI003B8C81D0
MLNTLVVQLFQRAATPPDQRPDRFGNITVIDRAEEADAILRDHLTFEKDFALLAGMGQSRFNLNGDRWVAFRGRTQPLYALAGRPNRRGAVSTIYDEEIARIDPANPATVEHAFGRAALRVFFQALQIEADVAPFFDLFAELRIVAAQLQYQTWSQGRDPEVTPQQAVAIAEETVQRFWALVSAAPSALRFVETSVADAGEGEGEVGAAVTDLMQNMFAGIETTMASLGWALVNLGKNAAVQDRALAAIRAGDEGADYLGTFLNESMRCMPPIPFVVRRSATGKTIGTRHFSEGQQILLSIIGVHRDPDAWAEPNVFDASRAAFLDAARPPRGFIPFLTGPRVCGGKRIAEMEMIEALRLFLSRYEIETAKRETNFNYALALRPDLSAISLRPRRASP